MPVVSPDCYYLLESHFKTGADYSYAKEYTDGSDAEIYNVNVFKKIIELVGRAEYSEYMKFYMINNKNIFNTNEVELPKEYIRSYRLTLDYPEDLKMFNKLFNELDKKKLDPTIMNVYKILDNNMKISAINNHLTMKYETDKKLIDLLNRKTTIKI